MQNPQARNHWLGEHPLYAKNLPHGESGRCVFLLSLTNKALGGTGDHEAFRQCMIDTLFTPASVTRETDDLSIKLMKQLAEAYESMANHAFFFSNDGQQLFWTKYLHHVLFGLDIESKEVMDTLNPMFEGELAVESPS